MDKLYYCLDCLRIFSQEGKCKYCNALDCKELAVKAPVNVIGTKTKGRLMKAGKDAVKILVFDNTHTKTIKEYPAESLRKIL